MQGHVFSDIFIERGKNLKQQLNVELSKDIDFI